MCVYCHPYTDCFLVSQLFSVTRHARRFKLGSKPASRYARHGILQLSHFGDIRQLRNYSVYLVAFTCLHFVFSDSGVLYLFEELCITRMAAVNSFVRVLIPSPGGGDHFYIIWTLIRLYLWPIDHCIIIYS